VTNFVPMMYVYHCNVFLGETATLGGDNLQ